MSQISSHPVSPPSTVLLPPPCSSRYLRKGIFLGLSSQIKFGGCSIKSGTFRAIFLKGFIMWKKKFILKVSLGCSLNKLKYVDICSKLLTSRIHSLMEQILQIKCFFKIWKYLYVCKAPLVALRAILREFPSMWGFWTFDLSQYPLPEQRLNEQHSVSNSNRAQV